MECFESAVPAIFLSYAPTFIVSVTLFLQTILSTKSDLSRKKLEREDRDKLRITQISKKSEKQENKTHVSVDGYARK